MKQVTCSKCRGIGKYHAMGFMFIDCKPCGGSGFVDTKELLAPILSEALDVPSSSELKDGDITKKHNSSVDTENKDDSLDDKYNLFYAPSGGVFLFPKPEDKEPPKKRGRKKKEVV